MLLFGHIIDGLKLQILQDLVHFFPSTTLIGEDLSSCMLHQLGEAFRRVTNRTCGTATENCERRNNCVRRNDRPRFNLATIVKLATVPHLRTGSDLDVRTDSQRLDETSRAKYDIRTNCHLSIFT